MARDRGGPRICHQWLDVPTTDATLSQSGHRDVGDGYLLDADVIDDFLKHYLADPAQALRAIYAHRCSRPTTPACRRPGS